LPARERAVALISLTVAILLFLALRQGHGYPRRRYSSPFLR